MSVSKIMILVGNLIATLFLVFYSINFSTLLGIMWDPSVLDTRAGNGLLLVWGGGSILVSLLLLIVGWIGFAKFDGVHRLRWRIIFLVLGIIWIPLGLLTTITYILAFALINQGQKVKVSTTAAGSQANQLEELEKLRQAGVISEEELLEAKKMKETVNG